MCVTVSEGAERSRKMAPDSMQLDLQATVIHHVNDGFSARAASSSDGSTIYPVSLKIFETDT